MSKKNIHKRKDNGYPLEDRCVIYDRKKNLQPIPTVGKSYRCFDDGKVRFSRCYVAKITEVLGFMEFRRKYPSAFTMWVNVSKECYWLFARSTDKFVIRDEYDDDNEHIFDVFVRTKDGGWFSFGNRWGGGELDVKGTMWDRLWEIRHDFTYTDDELEDFREMFSVD